MADRITDPAGIGTFLDAVNAKYDVRLESDFLDPAVNGSYAVRPVRAFALNHDDFTGSPTRWNFPEP